MEYIKTILINFKIKIKNIIIFTKKFFKKTTLEKKEIFFLLFFLYLLWSKNKKPEVVIIPDWKKVWDAFTGFFSFLINSLSSLNLFSTFAKVFLNFFNTIRNSLDFIWPFLSVLGHVFFYGFILFCLFFFFYNVWSKRCSIIEFVKMLKQRLLNYILTTSQQVNKSTSQQVNISI
jgi:hypothetical protein